MMTFLVVCCALFVGLALWEKARRRKSAPEKPPDKPPTWPVPNDADADYWREQQRRRAFFRDQLHYEYDEPRYIPVPVIIEEPVVAAPTVDVFSGFGGGDSGGAGASSDWADTGDSGSSDTGSCDAGS